MLCMRACICNGPVTRHRIKLSVSRPVVKAEGAIVPEGVWKEQWKFGSGRESGAAGAG